MDNKASLQHCPVCHQLLTVTEYSCPACDIHIQGHFAPAPFPNLTPAQWQFIRTFILAQGNIKEVERRLNISYPTVKSRLQEIILVMEPNTGTTSGVIDIINDISEGFISVEEALAMINQRRKEK